MNHKEQRAKDGKQGSQDIVADPLWALFTQALQHQQFGRLSEAEQIYRQILTVNPRHAHSLHMMGLIAFDIKRYDVAEELVRKAIAEQGNAAIFYHSLGNILKAQKKIEEAVIQYRQALEFKPDFADCLSSLGAALLYFDKKEESLGLFKRAVAANPQHFQALNNIGVIFQEQKKYDEAIEYYSRAIAIRPDFAEAHKNLGLVYRLQNNHKEAARCFELAVKYKPDYVDALSDLANTLRDLHKYKEAMEYYQKVASLRPDGYALANIASILKAQGQVHEAVLYFEKALALSPNSFEILNNLGTANEELGRYKQAADNYRQALVLEPEKKEIMSNLGTTLKSLGKIDESIDCFKQALTVAPDRSLIYSNLLLTMIYAESVSPEDLSATARQFGERIADPLRRQRNFSNDKNPDRKLRIGYVSPDFFNHSVNYFFEPLLKRHDRSQFEIFSYANVLREDAVTERLKKEIDHWRDIQFIEDDDAANMIESDRIDILIDLSGHTGRNKLMVFARKPAPVQVAWLGFPATTGMKAMDYRITDVHAEPEGMTEHLNVEALWRLPEIFCCYQPHENSPAVIDHPPFEDNGYITFGCFNNFSKVSDAALQVWSKILAQVPNARLLLEIAGIHEPVFCAETQQRLQHLGLPMERVILEPRKPSNQFILYNKIDIALDPFPCVGGTTSMDTLWMGVPFVTLAGRHFVSRMGVSILSNAGLSDLIANSTEEYIDIAVNLANDRERLKNIRHNLRDKVAASPVMDQESFARNMEAAYRQMWHKWCTGQ